MSNVALSRFLVAVSLFGLAVSACAVVGSPAPTDDIQRKTLIGLTFSAVCLLGTVAALRPRQCSRMMGFGQAGSPTARSSEVGWGFGIMGHHPACSPFQRHVISIRGRVFCAGCVGLSGGGIAAFGGAILYFFGDLHVWRGSLLPFWLGALGVAVGLLQFWPLKLGRRARLPANAWFAFGAFLVLAKADEMGQSLGLDLFLLVLIGFWIMTRIALAGWDHERTCGACTAPCGGRRYLSAL